MVNHGKRALALIFAALFVASPAFAQSITTQANSVFRDYNTPGNALSGIYNPPKADVRSLFGLVDTQIPHTADAHTWAATQTFSVAPVFTDTPGSRSALGLGTLAILNAPPAPTTSVRGGVLSLACSTGQFINSVDTSGTPTCATPTTGSSTAAAGTSGQFQTNSSGSLAGVTVSGAVSINGTTGISTLAAGQALANLGYTPVNKAGDTMTGSLIIQSALPQSFLSSTAAPTDNRNWFSYVDSSGVFRLQTENDAFSAGNSALSISRTGIIPTQVALLAPLYITTPIGTGAGFTFAGITQYSAQLIDVTGSNASQAEGGLLVNINANAGTDASHYKAGMVSQVSVNSGGGMGFGANFICNLAGSLANTATTGCNGMEIDVNNADADRSGNVWASNANRSVGLLVNGSGTKQNNSAVEITSARTGGPLWEVGLRFSQNGATAAIASAAIDDRTSAIASYVDAGTHTYGINLAGTYSGAAIIVQGSAGVTCAGAPTSSFASKGGVVTHC